MTKLSWDERLLEVHSTTYTQFLVARRVPADRDHGATATASGAGTGAHLGSSGNRHKLAVRSPTTTHSPRHARYRSVTDALCRVCGMYAAIGGMLGIVCPAYKVWEAHEERRTHPAVSFTKRCMFTLGG